jgi:hypothetical protein
MGVSLVGAWNKILVFEEKKGNLNLFGKIKGGDLCVLLSQSLR